MKKLILVIFIFSSGYLVAQDYSADECPVVGNTDSRKYHVAGGKHYAKMLRKNKRGDNRECFQNEDAAKQAGYVKSKT